MAFASLKEFPDTGRIMLNCTTFKFHIWLNRMLEEFFEINSVKSAALNEHTHAHIIQEKTSLRLIFFFVVICD